MQYTYVCTYVYMGSLVWGRLRNRLWPKSWTNAVGLWRQMGVAQASLMHAIVFIRVGHVCCLLVRAVFRFVLVDWLGCCLVRCRVFRV